MVAVLWRGYDETKIPPSMRTVVSRYGGRFAVFFSFYKSKLFSAMKCHTRISPMNFVVALFTKCNLTGIYFFDLSRNNVRLMFRSHSQCTVPPWQYPSVVRKKRRKLLFVRLTNGYCHCIWKCCKQIDKQINSQS